MPMNRKRNFLATCVLTACALAAFAQDLPKLSRPEEAGFSSERLSRITSFFQSEVDKGAIPGAVLLVGRNGKLVYRQAVGYQDREKKIPMKPDAVFRIFSMTKPVATVGVVKTDPVGKPALTLEPAARPITVQDLLRHTSGLVYGPFGNTLVHQEYN